MKKNTTFYGIVAVVATILCGLIYVSVQQAHRAAANDPQLQVARDMAERIKNDQSVDHFMLGDTIDLSKSLAVFKVLYDSNGEPIQATGLLDGQLPRLPKGVFDFTRRNKEDVLTWQPHRGIRMAIVVESIPGRPAAFVAVGRSLEEVEKRVSSLTTMILFGWLACLGAIIFHWIATVFTPRNKQRMI